MFGSDRWMEGIDGALTASGDDFFGVIEIAVASNFEFWHVKIGLSRMNRQPTQHYPRC
jgi:hypothetical protein